MGRKRGTSIAGFARSRYASESTGASQPGPLGGIEVYVNVTDAAEKVVEEANLRALREQRSGLIARREIRCAVRGKTHELLELITAHMGLPAIRPARQRVVLRTEEVVIDLSIGEKSTYCSLFGSVHAVDAVGAEAMYAKLLAALGARRITDRMFSVNWYVSTRDGLKCAEIEEMADDVLHNEAYPDIRGGLEEFVARYLASPESVLILQGPPGTGKTRLIRYILGAMSARRTNGQSSAMYTADAKILESDQLFVMFITGEDEAFVIEDADHLLRSRAHGNENLHRFLTVADGVVRAQARKIIFSTNLPNIGDLDDALVRPGRCFARVNTRALRAAEALGLVERLAASTEGAERAARKLVNGEDRTLAEIYKACEISHA